MAEARSAVRALSVDLRAEDLDEGKSAWSDFIREWRKSIVRGFFRTRNSIRNGMWPTSSYNLAVGIGVFSVTLIGDWQFVQPVNKWLWVIGNMLHINKEWPYRSGVVLVSCIEGVAFFVALLYVRRWLLRLLLSYRGWMYEPPHRQSLWSNIWGCAVWMVSGYQPSTYSCQKSLPGLPVPPLNVTIDRFLESIKPLYGEESEEYQRFKTKSETFRNSTAPKLQRILVLKSWWSQNYVTDWWEKYVYLMGRYPTPINSSYYVLDHARWCPTNVQVSRAASAISQFLMCKRLIDRETLPPLLIRNIIPVCMAQYERLFSTTRIPGEDFDELIKYDSSISKHVTVMRKGVYYKLFVYDRKGQPLTAQSLEQQLKFIMADAEQHVDEYSEMSRSISSLTACNRTEWSRTRSRHFSSGVNKESLDIVESAIFHVVLETKSFDSWTEQGKHLMHGDGNTFWFDKSFNALFFSNGKMGLNAEHSWGDAPVIGHMSEYNLTNEAYGGLFDATGHVMPDASIKQAALITPQRLVWDIPLELETTIAESLTFARKNGSDLDLIVVEHSAYGKGFIKTCKVSPDAYIQMALQLTYFKDSGGKFALTYESSMTRLYLMGRTETVRPLTMEASDFVRSMSDSTKTNAERIALLRTACNVHQKSYRDAMTGQGFDRHLFGLFVLCKGLGYDSDFLKEALMLPWTLSTSQQPQQQIATSPSCSDLRFQDMLCPGGGFGPVTDNGYGVSYMFPGDHRFFFHVSSKVSAPATSSARFVKLLFESLNDLKKLFESA